MKALKKWSIFLVVGLLMFSVAACSNSEGGDDSGNKNEITFWAPFSGPDGPKMKEIVKEYNESQDKYKVNFQIVPQSEYYKSIDLAFNDKKNVPDLLIMHGDQIITYAKKDVLKNLDDIIGNEVTKDQYHENAWEGATVDGSLYGVPLDIHPLMFYWNKDLFKAAGLDPNEPPKTREEFIEYAKQLTDADKQQYGYVVPTLWPQQFIFPTIVAQNNGSLFKDGKVNFNSDAVKEALQFQVDLIEKYKVSPADVQQDGEVTLFVQGKNAMHLNGPWMLQQWKDAGLNFGVAPVPQLGTEQQAVFANSHNFVIPKSADNDKVKIITNFLKFVGDNGMAWAESGQAPASKAVYTNDEFQKMKQQPQVAKQFDYAVFSPDVVGWGQVSAPLMEAVNLALLGDKSVEDALNEAQKKAEQIYEQQ
ncbi:ABC transporter substrate-binding protein [Alkalihalobacillus sp. AL-G]|uniref:ABC transporter substrate-binding protein n=1 Tax=Alkalihalobacillus sp. AL-G TaxID=2926399 RepID=UPI00272A3CD7|nr:ABC transporter substrate-binding protein [Alkalihalobacillus sp. AL-G]WLD92796.1 ABC transporter substrate-binding protein [Alkalihalobacillus sp. AL-G]